LIIKRILFSFFILVTGSFFAQDLSYNKKALKIAPKASIILQDVVDWNIRVMNLEMPYPGDGSYKGFLMEQKKSIVPKLRYIPQPDTLTNDTPTIGQSFQGNFFGGGTPNDNSMAISNDGFILSAINSDFKAYILNEDSLPSQILDVSLASFADTLNLPAHKYDPKLIYDVEKDKFIFVFLIGNDDSTNYIVVAFSTSSDPNDSWNIYALPGNPLDNKCWSDYPALGLSDNELFISVNQIITDSSWQTGFNGSMIWQIDKQSGYDGDSIITELWYNVKYENKFIRNLHPVKGGTGPYGDDIYFLSNRNFDLENDTVFLLNLSGGLNDSNKTLVANVIISDIPYGLPPVARQTNNHTFETNDSRVLGAFYEEGHIQFVGNCNDFETNTASIYHGIINNLNNTPTLNGHIISDTLDLGYPNISYSGRYTGDQESIISFLHCAPTVYSGSSCIFYDKFKGYSKVKSIKEGLNFVNLIGGPYERWGDYTGSQRRYNGTGEVWMSGSYANTKTSGLNHYRINSTWISSLYSPDTLTEDPVFIPDSIRFEAYPNPVDDWFNVTFDFTDDMFVNFSVYDIKGALVKVLLEDNIKAGFNLVSFEPKPLNSGIYFLRVINKNKILFSHKFIIQ